MSGEPGGVVLLPLLASACAHWAAHSLVVPKPFAVAFVDSSQVDGVNFVFGASAACK